MIVDAEAVSARQPPPEGFEIALLDLHDGAASRADHVRRGDLTAAPLADGLAHRLFIDRAEAGA